MASWKIAHLHQQGQDMIIVPLESAFGNKPGGMQSEFIEALQICAADAGLAGIVVPVWKAGSQFKFIAPQPWHPFFRSLHWNQIIANLNKTLTCN